MIIIENKELPKCCFFCDFWIWKPIEVGEMKHPHNYCVVLGRYVDEDMIKHPLRRPEDCKQILHD